MLSECAVTCDMLIHYLNLIGLCSIASDHTVLQFRVVLDILSEINRPM